MSRTPKWVRRQNRRFRGSAAQERDLRWLWRFSGTRPWWEEIQCFGRIIWRPTPGARF